MSEFICSRCYNTSTPRKKKRGSTGMEIFMWTLFPLGVPYTLWRMFTKIPVCSQCDSELLVDIDSIMGQRLLLIAEQDMVNRITKPANRQVDDESLQPFPIPTSAPQRIIAPPPIATTPPQPIAPPPTPQPMQPPTHAVDSTQRPIRDPNEW